MALIPTTPSEPDKSATKGADSLLREVDEAVRQDEFADLAKRYGKPVGAVLVAGLLAFAGWLWWSDRQEVALEADSETIVLALDQLDGGKLTTAAGALAPLEGSGNAGAAAVSILTRAGMALKDGRTAEAIGLYAKVSADSSLPKPLRDLATVREVAANYANMKPADVVTRLKPLATPGSPFFGSAGELLGAAYLDQGRNDLAGPLFGQIAKDKDLPESLRYRARRLAGQLGVDAVDDVDSALKEASADQGALAGQ